MTAGIASGAAGEGACFAGELPRQGVIQKNGGLEHFPEYGVLGLKVGPRRAQVQAGEVI